MAKKLPQAAPEAEDSKGKKRKQVELDPDLARKIGVIAGALDISVPDYVNNRLRPIVKEELPRILKELGASDLG